MCVLAVLYVGVVEGSAFWSHLHRWLPQCPASSVLVNVCAFGVCTEAHYGLNFQRGKQLPQPSVWGGETSRHTGLASRSWARGIPRSWSPQRDSGLIHPLTVSSLLLGTTYLCSWIIWSKPNVQNIHWELVVHLQHIWLVIPHQGQYAIKWQTFMDRKGKNSNTISKINLWCIVDEWVNK